MPNPALEPGEPEIPFPGVVPWNPDRTLERLGPVSHAARELEEIEEQEKEQPPAFQRALPPLEASGPITRLPTRYTLGRPAGRGSSGVSP
jgi:hypothetical protein